MAILKELTGQLGRIKFIFFPSNKNEKIGIPYSPAYNPTSFSVSYSSNYDSGKKIPVEDAVKKFTGLQPRTLTMELFFDGTGASPGSSDLLSKVTSAVGAKGVNTVDVQIETFLGLAYLIKEDVHEPNNILVVWGSFILRGVLVSASVSYTMFAPNGRPLRAKMNITINETTPSTLLNKLLGLQSPDLSKSIIVKEGDTLPLLCDQEYSDSSLYPKVAAVNNLKNYRKLKQGMELLFPPIDNLA